MEPNFERLKAHILSLSNSNIFDSARQEWDLEAVEISEEFDQCPCGQQILEHCYIRNRLNGNSTYVGNVCIKRFVGIDTVNLFDGLKRIAANLRANANTKVIEYAQQKGYLYDGEYDFLIQTRLLRLPSEKRAAWKEKINRRILKGIVVSKRTSR